MLGFGLAVEAVQTTNDFTHVSWVVTRDLASRDKVRPAQIASQNRASEETRAAVTALFNDLIDSDASRQGIARTLIFKVAAPK